MTIRDVARFVSAGVLVMWGGHCQQAAVHLERDRGAPLAFPVVLLVTLGSAAWIGAGLYVATRRGNKP